MLEEQRDRDKLDEQVAQQGTGMSDIDLEVEMEKGVPAEETEGAKVRDPAGEKEQEQLTGDNQQEQRDLASQNTEGDDYSRPYRTGAQERLDRGSARREKQEREAQDKAR